MPEPELKVVAAILTATFTHIVTSSNFTIRQRDALRRTLVADYLDFVETLEESAQWERDHAAE